MEGHIQVNGSLYERNANSPIISIVGIAALSVSMFVPTDNSFAQSFVFPLQPTASWSQPAPAVYAPSPWPVNYPNAPAPAHQTSAAHYPMAPAYLPPSLVFNGAVSQVRQPQTNASYYQLPHSYASAPSPVQDNFVPTYGQLSSAAYPVIRQPYLPTSTWEIPAPQGYVPPSWPVIDRNAASRTYMPPFWPIHYAYLDDEPTASEDPAPATNSNSNQPSLAERLAARRRESESSGARSKKNENTAPFISTQTFCYWNDDLGIDGKAELPVLGRMNVCEHNSPLPRDRAYGIYKHYSHVLDNSVSDFSGNTLGQSSRSIDRYLFGYEKTFHDGCSSLEMRMPFTRTGSSQFNAGFASDDPSIGNLGVFGKRLVYSDDLTSIAAGCGVTMPTGDDTFFTVGSQTFSILNNSAHVIPFLGFYEQTPDQKSFVMFFAGLDIPTRGNDIQFLDPVAGTQDLGKLVDQTLLYLDFTLGHWFYRNPTCNTVTGFAAQAEFHYAGTLNDAKSVTGVASGVGWNTGYDIGSTQNRFHSTFVSAAVQLELRNQTDIRVAGIFPLNEARKRFFESELIVALVQRF